jgi:hypothetical protein
MAEAAGNPAGGCMHKLDWDSSGDILTTYSTIRAGTGWNSPAYLATDGDNIYWKRNFSSAATSGFESWEIDDNSGFQWTSPKAYNNDNNIIYRTNSSALYMGGSNSTDLHYFDKCSKTDGSVTAQYQFKTTGTRITGYVAELGSDYVIETADASYTGPDGTFNIWVLDGDMNFVAGYLETDSAGMVAAVGAGPPLISSSTPTDLLYDRALVAFSGDSVFYEDSAGSMSEITETGGGIGEAAADTFDMTESLTAAEAYQKIFVANNTTLAVVDFVNTRIAASTTFTNVSLAQHGTLLYQNGASPATILVDTVLGTSVVNKTMVARHINLQLGAIYLQPHSMCPPNSWNKRHAS